MNIEVPSELEPCVCLYPRVVSVSGVFKFWRARFGFGMRLLLLVRRLATLQRTLRARRKEALSSPVISARQRRTVRVGEEACSRLPFALAPVERKRFCGCTVVADGGFRRRFF